MMGKKGGGSFLESGIISKNGVLMGWQCSAEKNEIKGMSQRDTIKR